MDSQALLKKTRSGARGGAFDFLRRGDTRRGEPSLGFHESSFDLRSGLDVFEMSVATLPDEVVSEFRRQRSALRVSP